MAPKDQSLEFIMYRLESLEKRLEGIEKRMDNKASNNPDVLNILLKLLEKQATTTDPAPHPVPTPPSPKGTKTDDDAVYDTLLSFARRRTIA